MEVCGEKTFVRVSQMMTKDAVGRMEDEMQGQIVCLSADSSPGRHRLGKEYVTFNSSHVDE